MSPDGSKILFHSNRNFASISPGDQDIYSMDPDGSNVQDVTNDSNVDRNYLYRNWSTDGRQFVFERATSNFASSNIYKMNADGTGLTQLTFATSGLNRFPVWSPDGTRISFDSIRDTPPAPAPQNREVYTMKTDGSDVQRVTNAPGSDSQCDWQTIPLPSTTGPGPGSSISTGPTAATTDTTAPGVSSYGVTNSPFAVGGGSTPAFGFAAAKKGTKFVYTLSEAATVRIVIFQRRAGRRKGIRCVAPRRAAAYARRPSAP